MLVTFTIDIHKSSKNWNNLLILEYTDFGYYGCAVTNRLGMDEKSILLEKKGDFLHFFVIAFS